MKAVTFAALYLKLDIARLYPFRLPRPVSPWRSLGRVA